MTSSASCVRPAGRPVAVLAEAVSSFDRPPRRRSRPAANLRRGAGAFERITRRNGFAAEAPPARAFRQSIESCSLPKAAPGQLSSPYALHEPRRRAEREEPSARGGPAAGLTCSGRGADDPRASTTSSGSLGSRGHLQPARPAVSRHLRRARRRSWRASRASPSSGRSTRRSVPRTPLARRTHAARPRPQEHPHRPGQRRRRPAVNADGKREVLGIDVAHESRTGPLLALMRSAGLVARGLSGVELVTLPIAHQGLPGCGDQRPSSAAPRGSAAGRTSCATCSRA